MASSAAAPAASGNPNEGGGSGGGAVLDVQTLLMKQSSNPTYPNSAPPLPSTYSFPAAHSTAPPFSPHHFHNPYQQHQQQSNQPQPPPPNPNHGARLMALLTPPTNQPPSPPPPTSSSSLPATTSEYSSVPPRTTTPHPIPTQTPPPLPLPTKKPPKGRKLSGHHVSYDVDVRFPGELQPQLEVTPITKYVTDPTLTLGRQIAVNSTYICYGLRQGAIRILNINTALRALLRGHTQRVTDMAFFSEEVHLLASVSVDGAVFVWKINEGPDVEDKPQITGQVIIAIQMVDEGISIHPRVCWYSHKQEYLVVGIGKRVLKIDTTKVGKNEIVSAELPLKCPVNNLIDGVQFVGKHDGEVTDLSMCQWMTTRLVSASTDGTVKIWEDRKELPLVVLRPHDGQPVYAAIFLTAIDRPNHINLVTAGALNREVKVWASASEEGWLLPSDAESWHCTQILDLKSSDAPRVEDAFFNQVLALPRAGLVLLANAKRNAIYAIHIEYGQNPAATRMDYIAEFTVTMPILSLTGISDYLPDGEHVVQVYCVQTQAIQQYALDLSQCLPPTPENMGLEKSHSGVYCDFDTPRSDGFGSAEPRRVNSSSEILVLGDAPNPPRYSVSSGISEVSGATKSAPTSVESKQSVFTTSATDSNNVRVASPHPLSPRIPEFTSPSESLELGLPPNVTAVDQPAFDYVDRIVDTTNLHSIPSWDDSLRKDEKEVVQTDLSVPKPTIMFKHPTHLITPSEILSMSVSSCENTQVTRGLEDGEPKVVISHDADGVNVETKVVRETGSIDKAEADSQRGHLKDKAFCSQASSLSFGMTQECCALSTEPFLEIRQADNAGANKALDHSQSAIEEEILDSTEDMTQMVSDKATEAAVPLPMPASRGKKQKGKISQISGPSSPSPSPFNSTDSSSEPTSIIGVRSMDATFPQVLSMQETLTQLMTMQKEMQKQMATIVAVPITKEGKRIEASLTRGMEKVIKANTDALWARFQEENAKHERLEQERTHQIMNFISNYLNKDLPSMLERVLKKELAAVGQVVARLVTPVVEKSISSSITESFQRGVGDKAVTQLEKSVNSKLEGTIARQIQAQFQTSGKQALQDVLRYSMEASVIPAFETSCKAMFEQVDMAFQKGMVEHTAAAQQQFEATHSPLTLALREAISSASSITQTITGELADGQRKLLALAAAGANSKEVNPLVAQLSNRQIGGIHEIATPIQHVETPVDPTKELSRLISEQKFGEAFTQALQRSDVFLVSWLCSQVDLQGILRLAPLPLSQGVLLALLQQLACDISNDTSQKLAWMRDVAIAINPTDPMIAVHARPIFEQVYQLLGQQCSLASTTAAEMGNIRLVMHVINSMLTSCK